MRLVSDVDPRVRTLIVGPRWDVGGLSTVVTPKNGDFEFFGPVWPASAALVHLAKHLPEIVVIQFDPEEPETRDLIHSIRARFPSMKVVVMGPVDSPESIRETVELGVSAYLALNCSADRISAALRALSSGHLVIEGEAARMLFGTAASRTPLRRVEVQVLKLLAAGLTNEEITAELEISTSTLKRHLNQIEQKLGARNRVQAVANATRQGLL